MTLVKKNKVGILIDSEKLTYDQLEFVERISKSTDVFESVLFLQVESAKRSNFDNSLGVIFESIPSAFKQSIVKLFLRIIKKLELAKIRKLNSYRYFGKYFDVGKRFNFVSIDSLSTDLDVKDQLDILVNFTSSSELCLHPSLSRLGIIGADFGDGYGNKRHLLGFWEVLLEEPSTGFMIYLQRSGLDDREILLRGNIATGVYWIFNLALVQKKMHAFLFDALKKLVLEDSQQYKREPLLVSSRAYRLYPTVLSLVLYFVQAHVFSLIEKLKFSIWNIEKYNWSVSFLRKSGGRWALQDAETIKNPDGRFLADPFLFEYKGDIYCFVEDYFKAESKGKISVLKLINDEMVMLGVVLEEAFHLSYPFVFYDNEDIYMIPEASRSGSIRLYKAKNFPFEWQFVTTLLDGVKAVDTTVFKIGDKWYLLTNFCSADVGDNSSELHLYSSDALTGKKWYPSFQNPVIFDSSRARNGGFFHMDGKMFRVGQIQTKGCYGKGFKINEIVRVDPNFYDEKLVQEVMPIFFKGICSTHHFSCVSNYVAFDHR